MRQLLLIKSIFWRNESFFQRAVRVPTNKFMSVSPFISCTSHRAQQASAMRDKYTKGWLKADTLTAM